MAKETDRPDRDNISGYSENGRENEENKGGVDVDIPSDGGWGWAVVLASLISNTIYDGCSYSFGIFYIEFLEDFQDSKSNTAWIGSLFFSIPLLFAPLSAIITRRLGSRMATMLGGFITVSGFFIGSFSKSIWVLVICYGVIGGFGMALPYFNAFKTITDYFRRRLTLASGLSESGAGLGTVIFVPLTRLLVTSYGWRGTLIILSGIVANILVCGALYRPIKRRRPCRKVAFPSRGINSEEENSTSYKKHLRSASLWLHVISNFVMYLWYDVPYVFLIDRVEWLGMETELSTYLLLIIGSFHFIGNILYGFIGKIKLVNCEMLFSLSIALCGIVLALVPFLYDFAGHAIISALFGLFSASTEALMSCILIDIVGKRDFDHVFCGLLLFMEGVANLIGPPIAGLLYDITGNYDLTFFVAGGSVMITGSLFAVKVIVTTKCKK